MKAIFLSLIAVLLTACATPDFNYTPQTTQVSEPPLDSINTAYVGDVLLRQGIYAEHDAIYVSSKIDVPYYDILPGYYLKRGEDKKTETYLPSGGDDSGDVVNSFFGGKWQAVIVYKNSNKICIIDTASALTCVNSGAFERRKKPILSADSFQQTLIYNGTVGNKINIGYREFSNSLARPAFNNNVEYDLSESKTIGYKGASIEIIEANNQYIKYKVIRNFNNAQL